MNRKLKRRWRKFKFALSKSLFPWYARLKYNKTVWQYLNRHAVRSFNRKRPKLDTHQKEILESLNQDGIAITSIEKLYGNNEQLDALLAYVKKRADRIRTNHKKPFLEDMLSEIPELGYEIPFFELATDQKILDIVNSYLGMHSRLTHFMLRRTKIMGEELPSHSQNWHRAPQERKNCRVYIYLNDVNEGSGAFSYIPKSIRGKEYGSVMAHTASTRGYMTAELVEQKVPEADRLSIYGKAGTVIFCDSTGLHRGGYSTKATRVMSTFGYSAPSFRENIGYSYTPALKEKLATRSVAASWILQPRWQRNQS